MNAIQSSESEEMPQFPQMPQMPQIPGMPGQALPPGIFAHTPEMEGAAIEGIMVAKETVEVAVDMMPGTPGFGRFKREAKGGGGGRLPTRNG